MLEAKPQRGGGKCAEGRAAPPPLLDWPQALQRNCQAIGDNLARLQRTVARHLPQLRPPVAAVPVASLSQAAGGAWGGGHAAGGGVSREEIGRATWTFLHTLAAQYPENPTRQQQRDARNLMDILTRMYPCGECARHFRSVVAASPPAVADRAAFSRWMCEAHNRVNRRLGKPAFNCALVEARWAGVECDGEGEGGGAACSLEVGRRR